MMPDVKKWLPLLLLVVTDTASADFAQTAQQWYNGGGYFASILTMLMGISVIIGAIFTAASIYKLKSNAENPQRFTMGGIVIGLAAGAFMISIPMTIDALGRSIFGASALNELSITAATGTVNGMANGMLGADLSRFLVAFVMIVGVLAVMKGVVILYKKGNGDQQSSMGMVLTHLIAGSLCINLHAFSCMIADSFNIQSICIG